MSSRSFRVGRSVTGLGLFATKPIKRGVYIATYRGRRITTEEADRREARGARYQFELNKRWTIDGSPRWNLARYINHSCRPNAKPVGRRGGIVIVASAPNRAGGGNHLRLWAGVSEALFGEWRLPLRSMPQKESSSSPESAQGAAVTPRILAHAPNRSQSTVAVPFVSFSEVAQCLT